MQSWTVDSDASNRFAERAEQLGSATLDALAPERRASNAESAEWLAQLCIVNESLAIVGIVSRAEAWTLAPGGRLRMRRAAGPSRASGKLEEALQYVGHEPGPDDLCVDLGAAPGGWTERLIARGAQVIAVDPAKLSPELTRHPRVKHRQESAFAFEPDEPIDWLFCDMAWRPLEVAQLLAKWARRRWARMLVANIKLPMRDKNPMVWRVRQLLVEAGWSGLRVKQLYHDRDEVTVMAVREGR